MSPPLTFGIELEMAVACWIEGVHSNPNPRETRCTQFCPIPGEAGDDIPQDASGYPADMYCYHTMINAHTLACQRHIRCTLLEAGFPVDSGSISSDNVLAKWDVGTDSSVCGPPGETWSFQEPSKGMYDYLGIELRSPAYFFSREALLSVERVCNILSNTYCINVNSSTGFHVHIGNGDQGFDFDTLRDLAAFLWTFEPQLNSLHARERQDTAYATSMREQSQLAYNHNKKHGKRISPMEGQQKILRCTNIDDLTTQISDPKARRECAYNFTGLGGMSIRVQVWTEAKPTVEFRQHAGTIDGPTITTWVTTVHGIISYILSAPPPEVYKLLELVKYETWEKLGDGKDDEREEMYGPILAEKDFSVIHLLQHMKLHGPALFYNERWCRHPKMKNKSYLAAKLLFKKKKEPVVREVSTDKTLVRMQNLYSALRIASKWDHGFLFDGLHPAWSHIDKQTFDRDSDIETDGAEYELDEEQFSSSEEEELL